MLSFLIGSEVDKANSITKEAVFTQRCIYVQDCAYRQFWRLVLVNVASMHILFFYTKIWYNSLSALKCIWQERYFQNLLCWLLPGVVPYFGVVFFGFVLFFQTQETMIVTKSKHAFLVPPLVQYNPSLVTVLFEMRSHHQENALLMTVKISKVLFMNTLIYCVILCFYNCDMPLPYQLSRGHRWHRCWNA